MLIMKILTDSVDFTEPTNAFMEGLLKTSSRHMNGFSKSFVCTIFANLFLLLFAAAFGNR
jgi:hypothetical protein